MCVCCAINPNTSSGSVNEGIEGPDCKQDDDPVPNGPLQNEATVELNEVHQNEVRVELNIGNDDALPMASEFIS